MRTYQTFIWFYLVACVAHIVCVFIRMKEIIWICLNDKPRSQAKHICILCSVYTIRINKMIHSFNSNRCTHSISLGSLMDFQRDHSKFTNFVSLKWMKLIYVHIYEIRFLIINSEFPKFPYSWWPNHRFGSHWDNVDMKKTKHHSKKWLMNAWFSAKKKSTR